MRFISPNGASSLRNFKYNGEDQSLIYKYILSPLAEFLVRLLPKWIAPNVITMFGMSLMILSYVLIWYCCPTITEAFLSEYRLLRNNVYVPVTPRIIFLINGLAMLFYQTLDNMDGKQARRTGSSSALGLLFDHGCDAFNSMLGSANWMVAVSYIPLLYMCLIYRYILNRMSFLILVMFIH